MLKISLLAILNSVSRLIIDSECAIFMHTKIVGKLETATTK